MWVRAFPEYDVKINLTCLCGGTFAYTGGSIECPWCGSNNLRDFKSLLDALLLPPLYFYII